MKLMFSLLLLAVAMATVAALPRWSNLDYQGAGGYQGGGGGFQQGGGGGFQQGGGGFPQVGGGFQQNGGGYPGGFVSSGRVGSIGYDNSNERGYDHSNERNYG